MTYKLRWPCLFLLFASFGQVCLADDPMQDDVATVYGKDGLKPLFTRCYKDEECVYVSAGCGGAESVNRMSQPLIQYVLQERSAHINCAVAPGKKSPASPSEYCNHNKCDIR